jgi:hypothetical protein
MIHLCPERRIGIHSEFYVCSTPSPGGRRLPTAVLSYKPGPSAHRAGG